MYFDDWLYELKMPSAAFANPNGESSGLFASFWKLSVPNGGAAGSAASACAVCVEAGLHVCRPATFVRLIESRPSR